jgi:hypothetical protein
MLQACIFDVAMEHLIIFLSDVWALATPYLLKVPLPHHCKNIYTCYMLPCRKNVVTHSVADKLAVSGTVLDGSSSGDGLVHATIHTLV